MNRQGASPCLIRRNTCNTINIKGRYNMQVSTVLDKLQAFRDAAEHYRKNDNLSQVGRERALKNLKEEQHAFRQTALQSLGDAWNDVRLRFKLLELKQDMEDVKQARGWDYSALNYHTSAVKARIQSARSLQDVQKWYPDALQSGDKSLVRAVAEAGASELRVKYGREVEAEHMARMGDAKLAELLDSPVYHEVQAGADVLISDVQTLQEQHEQVKGCLYDDASFWGYPDDFDKLTEGISLTQKYDSQVATIQGDAGSGRRPIS